MTTGHIVIVQPGQSEPRHIGSYPRHHALWHLQALGVVDDLEGFASPGAWDTAPGTPPATVVLIDTNVAMDHPCLSDSVDRAAAMDFTTRDHGVFAVPAGGLDAGETARRTALTAAAQDRAGSDFPGMFMADLADSDSTQDGYLPAANPAFADHGTAMAGLIGARPVADVWRHRPAILWPQPGVAAQGMAGEDRVALPYAGIDPRCRIVPVQVSADPDPDAMRTALVYADLLGADLIVYAGSLPDPARTAIALDADGGRLSAAELGSRVVGADDDLDARWTALEEELLAASAHRLILCAAGNGADGILAYPAVLATRDEPNGIVAVAACGTAGRLTTYSAGDVVGQAATIRTLSGDRPQVHAQDTAIDLFTASVGADDAIVHGTSGARPVPAERLVTTDVPGRGGYGGGIYGEVWRPATAPDGARVAMDVASFFCTFGGTSAATAVAGGLVALGYTSGIIDRATPPHAVKAALVAALAAEDGSPFLDWPTVRNAAQAGG